MKYLFSVVIVLLLSYLALNQWGTHWVAAKLNAVDAVGTLEVTREAEELHKALRIMDWHADTLLWKRSMLDRVDHSHVDLPRLRQGNVGLQMFTVVSKSPYGMNNRETKETWDMITAVAVSQGWPKRTWGSLFERAMYQSERLGVAVSQSEGKMQWVRDQQDLADWAANGQPKGTVAALFGSEGGHILEGNLENIAPLYDAGLRMMGLQHFFDNRLGGSLHGVSKKGLTTFGEQVIRELEQRQIIVDLAHSSEAVVSDVLAVATRPVVISHTGFKGVCDSPRNIADDLMVMIAEAGGLIAVGYWDSAICDPSPMGIAKAIQYGVELVGEDHVVLGSDFDGTVTTPFHTGDLVQLTQALINLGLTDAQIRKVMGENSFRFLAENLPVKS